MATLAATPRRNTVAERLLRAAAIRRTMDAVKLRRDHRDDDAIRAVSDAKSFLTYADYVPFIGLAGRGKPAGFDAVLMSARAVMAPRD